MASAALVFGEIAVVVVNSIQGRWSLQVQGRRAHLRRAVAEPIGEIAVVGVSAQPGVQNREPSRVLSFLSKSVHCVCGVWSRTQSVNQVILVKTHDHAQGRVGHALC